MIRRLLPRLLAVLGLALVAACSNLTGPQSSALSTTALTSQDPAQTTDSSPQQRSPYRKNVSDKANMGGTQ